MLGGVSIITELRDDQTQNQIDPRDYQHELSYRLLQIGPEAAHIAEQSEFNGLAFEGLEEESPAEAHDHVEELAAEAPTHSHNPQTHAGNGLIGEEVARGVALGQDSHAQVDWVNAGYQLDELQEFD